MNIVTVEELQDTVRRDLLVLRSLEGIVTSLEFKDVFNNSSDTEKKEAIELITNRNKAGLKRWMDTHPSRELIDLQGNDLKAMCRFLQVKNYSRLTHYDMIRALRKEKQANEHTFDQARNSIRNFRDYKSHSFIG